MTTANHMSSSANSRVSPFDGAIKDVAYFWAMFVVMFAVGAAFSSNPLIRATYLVVGGLPAMLTAWAERHDHENLTILGMVVLFGGGLTLGLLNQAH